MTNQNKRIMKNITVLSLVLGLCGCVSTPVINQADLSKVNFTELQSQKMGVACDNIILFFIPLERHASVAKAAFKAGIEHVSYVEHYGFNFYPLAYKNCVLVYGE